MEYELEELFENGATANEIGEWLSIYGRHYWRKKYFDVAGTKIYPIYDDDKSIIGYEFD